MKISPILALRRAHQKTLWEWPLWVIAGGAALEAIFSRAGVDPLFRLAVCGAAAGGAIFLRLASNRTLRDTARILDARTQSKNRFEALAEVGGRTDPLASALRAEAAQGLAGISLPRPYGWYSAFALIVLLLGVRILGPALGPAGWTRMVASPEKAARPSALGTTRSTSSKPVATPAAPPRLVSPEAKTEAIPGKIAPLAAGETSTARDGLSSELAEIEKAEERVPSATFALAHPAPLQDQAAAAKTLASLQELAAEQARISQEIADLISSAAGKSVAPELRERLTQIQKNSEQAAAALAAHDLAKASTALEIALSSMLPAITALAANQPAAAPINPNPATGASGEKNAVPISAAQLSKLESAQRALADALSKQTPDTGIFAKQYGVAHELAQAGAGSGLPSDIVAKIQAAAAEAEAAAEQLNAGDPLAAKEPAERAAMDLNQALKGLASDAKSEATATLAAVQRMLIRAADAVKSPEKSGQEAAQALGLTQAARKTLLLLARKLENTAAQQAAAQELKAQRAAAGPLGSGKSNPEEDQLNAATQKAIRSLGTPPGFEANAQQLRDLDDDIAQSKIESDLQKLIDSGASARQTDKDAAGQKLLDLAKEAAGRISMSGTPEDIASAALKNLRADQAKAKTTSPENKGDLESLAVDATAQMQVAEKAEEQAATSSSSNSTGPGGNNPGGGAGSNSSGGPSPSGSGSPSDGGSNSATSGAGNPGGNAGSNSSDPATSTPNSGGSSKSSSASFPHPEGAGDGEGTSHGSSPYLIKSVSKEEISGDDKPAASPDILGTGDRINPGLSSAQASDHQSSGIHFGPASQKPADQVSQSTVGKSMSAAEVLNQQIGDAIQRLQKYAPVAPRTNLLATEDSSQAPPDYRAAVADYFEALAKTSSSQHPPSR